MPLSKSFQAEFDSLSWFSTQSLLFQVYSQNEKFNSSSGFTVRTITKMYIS